MKYFGYVAFDIAHVSTAHADIKPTNKRGANRYRMLGPTTVRAVFVHMVERCRDDNAAYAAGVPAPRL